MITYGHEEFIKQAIQGVLMQQCDFEVELIIANDCSPDNTDNVVKEILQTETRASWIKYTRQARNLGVTTNLLFALGKCKGDYIAFCEGDDYWTDPLKLQKQRDYFLSNPGIGLVYTDYNIFMQNTGQLTASYSRGRVAGANAVYNDLIKNNFIAMLTVMANSKILLEASQKLRLFEHNWSMADYPLWLYIAAFNKIAYLPECTATYRYLPVSASHTASLKKNLNFLKSVFLIRLYFHKHIKKFSIKNLLAIYRIFYHESYLYIFRKFKQKIYDRQINSKN
jgi:glycosyltransferase involved in cell wall biosynthesis